MTVAQAVNLVEIIPDRDYDQDAVNELEHARLVIEHEGNFTTAVFVSPEAGIAVGVSKRNPSDDPMVAERGEEIAIIRAYRSYVDNGWQ